MVEDARAIDQSASSQATFSDRRRDILTGRLQTAVIGQDSIQLFLEAGERSGFRVWEVAGPGQKVLTRIEESPEIYRIGEQIVGEGFIGVAIEQIRKGCVNNRRFWQEVQVIQEGRRRS